MKEFNALPKMKSDIKCYKEGGAVYKSRHSETSEGPQDVAQDKKIVKKAFSMHDKQEHEGSKTDLSKLRRGGRAKKEKGTVSMFKDGGMTKVKPTGDKKARAPSAAMKFKDGGMVKVKPTGDKKACAPSAAVKLKAGGMTKVKPTGDKKADAPSKAAVKGKETPSFAAGGRPGAMSLESRRASGYSNLRDYLNSLSGKRRADETPAQHEAIQAAAAAKRGEAYSKPQPMNVGEAYSKPQPMNVGEGEKTSQADMSKYDGLAEGGSMTPEMMQQVQDAYQQRASGSAYGNAMTYPDSQDANNGMGGISPAERAILAKLMARKRLGSGAPAAPSPMTPQRPPMPMPPSYPGYADGGAIPMGGMGPAQPSGGMGAAANGVIPQPGAMQPQQQGLISPYRTGF